MKEVRNMSKSITVFSFLLIFVAAQLLPSVELSRIDGRAYAGGMMGDIKMGRKFTGKIEEIDQNRMIMAVIKKVGDNDFRKVFTFEANTPVSFGAENKNISDLKAGDKVVIRYELTGGRNLVSSIALEK